MAAPEFNLAESPQEYFRARVADAIRNQSLEVDTDLEFYVVNVLCDFVKPRRTADTDAIEALAKPLALMLKDAVEAPPSKKLRILKYLGDTSLYMAGFFQDYFRRKSFSLRYYMDLGTMAYSSVSGLMRDRFGDEHFSGVYWELAEKFRTLVDVLSEVSEPLHERDSLDLVTVYDRWTRSQSERLKKVLLENGIIPMPIVETD